MIFSISTRSAHASRITRGATAFALGAVALLPTIHAQDIIGNTKKSKPKGAFPTLSILPEGSILRRVRLPRYDKEFIPTSLLAADQLTVLDKNRIEGEGVTIELYETDGSLQARSKMRRAIYDQEKSTLQAEEAVYLKGKNYVASGAGLIFHWESKQGFLNGPASTRFTYQKKDTVMNSTSLLSPRHRHHRISALLGSFLAMNTTILAEAPPQLTTDDLAALAQLSKPLVAQTKGTRSDTEKRIREQAELSENARVRVTPFLKKIGKNTLLIQAPEEQTPAEPPKPQEKPAADNPGLQPGESTLLVECDGGLYFDNDVGILVYLKNIRLTEDRFKLSCSDELKVFLSQEPEVADKKIDKDAAPKPDAPKPDAPKPDAPKPDAPKPDAPKPDAPKPDTPEANKDKKEENQLSSFGNLKQIIATGAVKVTRLDEQGRPFIAMAETASYEAKTGDIILRGGRPRLQQSANQYLEAQEPGQWIRVNKNGKLVTSNGKWKMVAVLKNR